MDEVIFEEFKGTGNQEIVLDRKLVDRRIWPSIDINRSGTRKEEMLLDPEEYRRVCILRRVLNDMNPPDAMELLVTPAAKDEDQRRVPDEHEHEGVGGTKSAPFSAKAATALFDYPDLHAEHLSRNRRRRRGPIRHGGLAVQRIDHLAPAGRRGADARRARRGGRADRRGLDARRVRDSHRGRPPGGQRTIRRGDLPGAPSSAAKPPTTSTSTGP